MKKNNFRPVDLTPKVIKEQMQKYERERTAAHVIIVEQAKKLAPSGDAVWMPVIMDANGTRGFGLVFPETIWEITADGGLRRRNG